jgi:hypothetical protein
LYLNTAHPDYDSLYVAGLVQANGSIWKLSDYQAQVIANAIIARDHAPAEAAAFRNRVRNRPPGLPKLRVVASERHTLETNYYDYRRALLAEVRRFKQASRMVQAQHDHVEVPKHSEPFQMAAE